MIMMIKNLLIIPFISFSIGITKAQVTNVLFIGNSYTYVNDLPTMIRSIAISFGDILTKDQSTAGGSSLNSHTTNTTTLSKMALGTWNYVVIQAQSQEPSFPPSQVASQTYPYAKILVDSIRSANPCSEPVFFMTWGRKNGDASNCASYPPICTYTGMQQRLRESYMEMADSNKATVAPVGVAWKTVRDSFPLIELYQPDESHPSIYGSYLAACVFYATLYKKSPIGTSYIPSGINATDALNLQTIASHTVLDSLTQWRVDANKPFAGFNYSGGGTINFTNTSVNGVTYFWDFGDGNSSTNENPNNTYINNGIYPVQLIVYTHDSCYADTLTQNITITTASIDNINNRHNVIIYPNPTSNFMEVKSEIEYNSIIISDITGKIIKTLDQHPTKIDVSDLRKGVYLIQLIGDKEILTRKFIKN